MMEQREESEWSQSGFRDVRGVSGLKGIHHESVLSPFLTVFEVVVNVVTELTREGMLSELLCADDLVLMC